MRSSSAISADALEAVPVGTGPETSNRGRRHRPSIGASIYPIRIIGYSLAGCYLIANSAGVTVSVGVATLTPAADQSPRGLLLAADQALYQAKGQGRNQVCVLLATQMSMAILTLRFESSLPFWRARPEQGEDPP